MPVYISKPRHPSSCWGRPRAHSSSKSHPRLLGPRDSAANPVADSEPPPSSCHHLHFVKYSCLSRKRRRKSCPWVCGSRPCVDRTGQTQYLPIEDEKRD